MLKSLAVHGRFGSMLSELDKKIRKALNRLRYDDFGVIISFPTPINLHFWFTT